MRSYISYFLSILFFFIVCRFFFSLSFAFFLFDVFMFLFSPRETLTQSNIYLVELYCYEFPICIVGMKLCTNYSRREQSKKKHLTSMTETCLHAMSSVLFVFLPNMQKMWMSHHYGFENVRQKRLESFQPLIFTWTSSNERGNSCHVANIHDYHTLLCS